MSSGSSRNTRRGSAKKKAHGPIRRSSKGQEQFNQTIPEGRFVESHLDLVSVWYPQLGPLDIVSGFILSLSLLPWTQDLLLRLSHPRRTKVPTPPVHRRNARYIERIRNGLPQAGGGPERALPKVQAATDSFDLVRGGMKTTMSMVLPSRPPLTDHSPCDSLSTTTPSAESAIADFP